MKFEIRRTSDWYSKPCEEAMKETRSNIDVRSIDSPYKIWDTEEEVQENWFSEGKNHRVENGRIKRDLDDEIYWTIEFNNLEELLEFQKRYDTIIISEFSNVWGLKLIEIKDK